MQFNSINAGMYNMYGTNTTGQATQSGQFQQTLQELAQDATTDPQAAMQLLQSLPPHERHALMRALREQDPQPAQSISSAFQSQQANSTSGSTATQPGNEIAQMIQMLESMTQGSAGQGMSNPFQSSTVGNGMIV